MFVSAIIVAGGRGARLGAERPKQLLDLGGRTMLQRSVDAFDRHPAVNEIVVVLPDDERAAVRLECRKQHVSVAGGARRQDSVAAGFAAGSAAADIVLVHDAARPFVSDEVIARVIDAAAANGAAVPATRARDTVKRADAAGGAVLETIPRETIWLAQTPQGFRRAVLADAMARSDGSDVTDEAMMAERAGHPVHVVEGDERNVKITTQEDLRLARRSLGEGGDEFRVGTGYDLHRLVEGRRLVLAGVEIPFDKGPAGHSDG
ncbi:MAG TPA: 2-C-methyl-D-erythritol 4-phosphate cytidylyltransferase, partial [Vicinamibacterales bacterium]